MKKIIIILTFIIFHSSLTQAQQAGSLDLSFGTGGKVFNNLQTADMNKNKMKVGINGKFIISGKNGANTLIVSRFNQNGVLDNTFGASGTFSSAAISGLQNVYDLVILSDNSIIILAYSNDYTVGCFIIKITSSGVLDNTFGSNGFKYFPNCEYNSMVLQSNEKIVLGGYVYTNSVYNMQVIRLNNDGTYDFSFGNDGVNNDGISTIDFGYNEGGIDLNIDNDGKILIIGSESTLGIIFLVKYNIDGSLDNGFDGDGKLSLTQAPLLASNPKSIVFQPDNKLIICSSTMISRLEVNGTFDTSFDNDGFASYSIGTFSDVKIQKDGKIIMSLLANSNTLATGVARINANGSLDTSFDGDGLQNIIFTPPFNGFFNAYSIEIQNDGKIIFGGVFNSRLYIVRLHGVSNFASNQGKMITQVGTSTDIANAVAIRPNGKIVAAGYSLNAVNASSNNDFALVGYNADGGLDYTFGNNALVKTEFIAFSNEEIKALAIQPDGKIIAAGTVGSGAATNIVVARYAADGSGLDATFGVNGRIIVDFSGTQENVFCMTLLSDGKILVAGSVANGTNTDIAVIKLTSLGGLDGTFNATGRFSTNIGAGYTYALARGIAIQTDNKIVLGVYANGDFGIVRLNATGVLDTSFDTDGKVTATFSANTFEEVSGVFVLPDGKIIVSGNTDFVGGQDDFAVMRFNTDGSLDNTFGSGGRTLTGFNINSGDLSTAMAVYPNGKIVVAGQAGYGTIALCRFNANGTIDTGFDDDGKITFEIGNGIDQVKAITLQTDGKIILAGNYANGANDDFALISLPACITSVISLSNPSYNYPNAALPNLQIGKLISATNLINASSNVIYRTSSSIILNAGFKADNGSVFKTEIVGCSY
jgi:uncharacterized delta-60 repeat protein